jgi:hypothetical protein
MTAVIVLNLFSSALPILLNFAFIYLFFCLLGLSFLIRLVGGGVQLGQLGTAATD